MLGTFRLLHCLNDRQAQIEVQLYNLEGSYLTDTAAHSGGNIIQGFEGYLKNQTTGRRKHEVSEADRMFSNSSLTYQRVWRLTGPCCPD
jgi:chromatin modification-related protein EAF6